MMTTDRLAPILHPNLIREIEALRAIERLVRIGEHGPGLRAGVRHVPCALCDEIDKVDAARRGEVEWAV